MPSRYRRLGILVRARPVLKKTCLQAPWLVVKLGSWVPTTLLNKLKGLGLKPTDPRFPAEFLISEPRSAPGNRLGPGGNLTEFLSRLAALRAKPSSPDTREGL